MLENLLLGTYTRRVSEGVYSITLDTEKGELQNLALATKEDSPTYVTRSQAKRVYTITSIDGKGGASAYTPEFEFLNAVTEEGAPLCYVAVDETRQLLYGANYHKGEVNVYRILENGSIEASDSVYHVEATGPHANQDKPHVHYTDLTPDNRLAVCDLGTDGVYTYDVSEDGKLTKVAIYQAEPGTGPRHLAFHPNGKIAYLFGELDSTVTVLAYDATNGTFTKLQKLSTLPEDFAEFNGGAAIRVSTDGRFLYASNRGHNSIAVYEINEEGQEISLIQLISTEGDFPRDFNLNPSNEFLVCANQNTDNLTLYRRNAKNGKLEMIQKDIFAPECVCVYFEK
ncbi:6-phosphogluconolactonase [Enterococcus sp. AZ194]|uniref:lactonase family protein n=1 Tax=Enterococcus sp. AZ194 TaxID=2774629 RepID=UPI003F241F8C